MVVSISLLSSAFACCSCHVFRIRYAFLVRLVRLHYRPATVGSILHDVGTRATAGLPGSWDPKGTWLMPPRLAAHRAAARAPAADDCGTAGATLRGAATAWF